jgi:hypothetical protein
MLENEKVEPRLLAYDRPSPKLLNFLSKYYGLNDFTPQNNNFVVFKDYFSFPTIRSSNKTSNDIDKTVNKAESWSSLSLKSLKSLNTTPNKKKVVPSNDETNFYLNFDKMNLNEKEKSLHKFDKFDKLDKLDKYSDPKFTVNTESSNKIKLYDKQRDIDNYEENRETKTNFNKSNNPPWAVSDDSFKFAASSSNYGAYYALKK